MRDFRFFRGYGLTTLDDIEGETRATASFNTDTPDGHVYRRRLYHTDRDLYDRLNNPNNNNEMERYYYDRQLGRFETVRPTPSRQEELIRRINGGGTDNIPPFTPFVGTSKVTINPKWWMKVKMFFQKLSLYSDQVVPITVIATTITFIVILIISKILNI
jgi:hypothetical protein